MASRPSGYARGRSYLKLDTLAPQHPKVAPLSDRAFRAWLESIAYCALNLSDGSVPAAVVRIQWARARAELLAAGLWEEDDDGIAVHDFLEWNDSKEEVHARIARARTAGQASGAQRSGAQRPVEPSVERPVEPSVERPVERDANESLNGSANGGLNPTLLSSATSHGRSNSLAGKSALRRGEEPTSGEWWWDELPSDIAYLWSRVIDRAPTFGRVKPSVAEDLLLRDSHAFHIALQHLVELDSLSTIRNPTAYLRTTWDEIRTARLEAS